MKRDWRKFEGNRKQAQAKLRELLSQLDRGEYAKQTKLTVSLYLGSWVSDVINPVLSPRTYTLYSYLVARHIVPVIGQLPLSELKPAHPQKLYAEKFESGLSARTVKLIQVVIHKALKKCRHDKYTVKECVRVYRSVPRTKRHESKIMNEADIHLFLEMARDTEYYSLFYCYLFTGCRRGELLAIKWNDVDLDGCQLIISHSLKYHSTMAKSERLVISVYKDGRE